VLHVGTVRTTFTAGVEGPGPGPAPGPAPGPDLFCLNASVAIGTQLSMEDLQAIQRRHASSGGLLHGTTTKFSWLPVPGPLTPLAPAGAPRVGVVYDAGGGFCGAGARVAPSGTPGAGAAAEAATTTSPGGRLGTAAGVCVCVGGGGGGGWGGWGGS
jgi:hypothetical protein